jgi:hypothetical protein
VFACQGTARERYGMVRVFIRADMIYVTYRIFKRGVIDFYHFQHGTTRTVKRSQHDTLRHEHDTRLDMTRVSTTRVSTTRVSMTRVGTNTHDKARIGTTRQGMGRHK